MDFLDGELSLGGGPGADVVGWLEPDEVEVLVKRSDEEGFRILWPDTRWGERPGAPARNPHTQAMRGLVRIPVAVLPKRP